MEQKENQFRQLIERYAADVLWLVERLIPQREDAEDVAQDVFVAVYENLERFDETKASFRTWLMRIAYYTAIKRLRGKGKVSFVEMEEEPLDVVAEDLTDELLSEAPPDRKTLLEQAVRLLSEADQLLLMLYYYHDKSVREIAYITGHKESYLHSRFQWLRKKLCTIIIKLEKDGKKH